MYPEIKTPGNTEWFFKDRFGMFIHWGLYTLPARHEWVMQREKMTFEDYQKYFDHFDPDLYDPEKWAELAEKAGMKYFVITTKHHEGFCLWDTKYTDYKVTNTPYGKDLVRPMVEAFRKRGIKVGFYHSIIDWHHKDYTIDWTHPRSTDEEYVKGEGAKKFERYTEYLHNQVRELLTDFGKIDILWFDFTPKDNKGIPGKTKEHWQSEKFIKMIRELQPEIIINDRLMIDQDIKTPEQFTPIEWLKIDGKRAVWEGCHTFSGSWGYHRDELTWKSPKMLIELLINHVSLGGNLLLNVGPNGRGELDERAEFALKELAKWMRLNNRSIYNCTQAPAEFQAPEGGKYTYNPETKRLYLHLYAYPYKRILLPNLSGKVKYAQFLHDASEVQIKELADWQKEWSSSEEGKVPLELPTVQPNVEVPVIELFLK